MQNSENFQFQLYKAITNISGSLVVFASGVSSLGDEVDDLCVCKNILAVQNLNISFQTNWSIFGVYSAD